jgi:hypothetical protein
LNRWSAEDLTKNDTNFAATFGAHPPLLVNSTNAQDCPILLKSPVCVGFAIDRRNFSATPAFKPLNLLERFLRGQGKIDCAGLDREFFNKIAPKPSLVRAPVQLSWWGAEVRTAL